LSLWGTLYNPLPPERSIARDKLHNRCGRIPPTKFAVLSRQNSGNSGAQVPSSPAAVDKTSFVAISLLRVENHNAFPHSLGQKQSPINDS
jgi:hypothetical protein